MKLPDFQDFLCTLTPEKITQILEDAAGKAAQTESNGSGGQISAISWTISLELLALYHLWLQDESEA